MNEPRLPLLLEPDLLEEAHDATDLLVLDLRKPEDYTAAHIPGALHADYEDFVTAHPPALGMLADEMKLSETLAALGLQPDTHVVAYDDSGGGRAARILWTLAALGHTRISLLDGGFIAWKNEAHPLETGSRSVPASDYHAQVRNPDVIASKDYVLRHLGSTDMVLLDTRSEAEYLGNDVRAARGGHIPGAVNFDWTRSTDRHRDRRLRPAEQLTQELAELDVTRDHEIVVYCQTHHRSAHTFIMLKHLGFPRVRGYAGAWSEWGNLPELPIEAGPPDHG